MSSRKGDRAERELSNWLEDEVGWYAQRTGSSGAATDRARPDVIACRGERGMTGRYINLIEVRAVADGTVTLGQAEIEDLLEAAERAGGVALVAVKPDLRRHDQWHIFDARALHETPSGNYSIRKQDLPGDSREEVFA